MHDQINKLVADAFRTHAAPLPDYAKPKGDIGRGFGTRFAGGWTEVTARPCGDEAIYRPGSYCTYAHRTTMIPLLPGARSITYWSPAVFFLPDDPALKPELAFDGDPFRRQARGPALERWLGQSDQAAGVRAPGKSAGAPPGFPCGNGTALGGHRGKGAPPVRGDGRTLRDARTAAGPAVALLAADAIGRSLVGGAAVPPSVGPGL